MSPQEFWWLFEAKKPPEKVGHLLKEDYDRLRKLKEDWNSGKRDTGPKRKDRGQQR